MAYMAQNKRDLQILLLGKTGVGKSATGNTILTANKFESQSSSMSVTQRVEKVSNVVDCRQVTVVDTPGLCDTEEEPDTTLGEIANAMIKCPDGYDAFVIVLRYPTRLTPEERLAIQQLEQLFGPEIFNYTIGIFTSGSNFEHATTFEEEIFKDEFSGRKGAIGPVVRKFKGGVVLFENKEKDEQKKKAMVSELISKIDILLHSNSNKRYDDELFQYIRREKKKLEDQKKEKELDDRRKEKELEDRKKEKKLEDRKKEREEHEEKILREKTVQNIKKNRKFCTIS